MSRPPDVWRRVYSVSPSPPPPPPQESPSTAKRETGNALSSSNGAHDMHNHASSSRGAGSILVPQRQPVPTVPVVGGSGARVPTQLLDRKGDFTFGHDVKPYTGDAKPQLHTNGHAQTNGHGSNGYAGTPAASSLSNASLNEPQARNRYHADPVKHERGGVKREIDLTDDDTDDIQVVDVKGPILSAHAPSSVPAAEPNRDGQVVCLGVLPALMVSILGLPPMFVSSPPARKEDYNSHPRWAKSEWPSLTGWEYYLEPGYRPAEVFTKTEPNGKYTMSVHEVIPALDVRAMSFGSNGLLANAPGRSEPQAKQDSFGRLTEKYPPVLCPWLLKHRLKIYARMKIVPPSFMSSYLHTIELLLFCARRDATPLATAIARNGIKLCHLPNYVPHGFPQSPPQELPMWLFPDAMRGITMSADGEPQLRQSTAHHYHDILQSRGTMIGPSKEESEEERRKQVDKVYQSLPDGEKLEETDTDLELITTPLMSHQKRALTFLLDREKERTFDQDGKKGAAVSLWKPRWQHDKIVSYAHIVTQGEQMKAPHICRGSILADDMGLGKTLTTISLIAKTFDEAREWSKLKPLSDRELSRVDDDDEDEDGSDDDVKIEDFKINMSGVPRPVKKVRGNGKESADGKKKGKRALKRSEEERARLEKIKKRSRATLLVLPLTLVSAWESQLREHWASDCMPKVYVHHGPNRLNDAARIAKHNIVMTTYSTLSSEYAVIATEDDDNLSDDDDDDAFDDGADTMFLTAAQKAQRVKKKLKAARLKRTAERRRKKREEGAFPLQQIEWFRVVLDEAHSIKDPMTMQSRAVCDLIARNRLALTGTPVQNRIDDLFALIKFLRLDPFDNRATWNQFCGSPVNGLTLQSARELRARRMAAKGVTEDDLDTMSIARVQTIMKFLTLRRTKDMKRPDGRKLLELPPKFSRLIELEFDDRERATYNEMRERYKDGYEKMKENDTLKYNYATILHEISNLRMTCDHMELVEASKDTKRSKEGGSEDDPGVAITEDGISRDRAVRFFDLLSNSDKANCMLCLHDLTNFAEDMQSRNVSPSALGDTAVEGKQPVLLKCLHLFCTDCVKHAIGAEMFERQGEDDRFACPECSEAVAPLTEMRTLVPGDVLQRGGANTLSEETFAADVGVPIDKRSDCSTKIRALLADLETFSRSNPASRIYDSTKVMLDQVAADATEKEMGREDVYIAEAAGTVAPIKSIVFSQWTTMLDRVARAVHRAGIRAARLDGRMLRAEREVHLEKFKSDPYVEVLLVSLKAGGVGLNLVSACRAYLMEPYWNPAVENQGLDRIYRMGQKRPVVTTKYIMSESIEENMLELQRRKTELAERAGGKRGGTMRREEELNILFGDRTGRNRNPRPSQASAAAAAAAEAAADSQTESEGDD